MALMHKPIGMPYYLDLERQDWASAFDGATLTQVLQRGDYWLHPSQMRELTDAEVELPRALSNFFGHEQCLHERPRYGYSEACQRFFSSRAA